MRFRVRVRVRVRIRVRVRVRVTNLVARELSYEGLEAAEVQLVLVSQIAAEAWEDVGVHPQHLIERACLRKMAHLMGTRVGVASTRVRGKACTRVVRVRCGSSRRPRPRGGGDPG